jgi:murein DD-endopeptidase MepM/ murein hydrolase activator NlpD
MREIHGTAGLLIAGVLATALSAAASAWAPVPTSSGPAADHTMLRAPPGPAYGTYTWPVDGPVMRRFEPPGGPYGPGHRGIDIAVPEGTAVVAAREGVVAFAGFVADGRYVSVDHPDGVRTTYSWLGEARVRRGREVARGEVLGATGGGHPGSAEPHLHFGARYGGAYIDPLLLLQPRSLVGLVRLAPLERPP